ncbi:MAG: stalk domain-containing protein [Firmicutes bacterium]|nr:stalk domain-containing protein [Bacillota bacterium]
MKLKNYGIALSLAALLAAPAPGLAAAAADAADQNAAVTSQTEYTVSPDNATAAAAGPTDNQITRGDPLAPTDNQNNSAASGDDAANRADNFNMVFLTLGSKQALLGDMPYQLEVPPEVIKGTTFLPIRFVAEQVLNATVDWNPDTKEISLAKNDTKITLTLNKEEALVNGQAVALANPPFVKSGRTLVPLRFLTENLAMQIDYNAADKTITIIKPSETPPPVNLPPVITSMGLQSNVLKIGEVPKYQYTYDNEPSGETIIAEDWNCQLVDSDQKIAGKPRAFFKPGQYTLSLKIEDAAGNWSDTATTEFTVTNEVLVSELTFKLSDPVYGEVYQNVLDNLNFNLLPNSQNVTFQRSGPELELSNSPEMVNQPGILFQNQVSGDFRLFYNHANNTADNLYLYVILANDGSEPVTLQTIRSGIGGPSPDYMNLGQTVALRFMSPATPSSITIPAGTKMLFNQGLRYLKKNEGVTAMYDFQASGPITLTIAMGPEKAPEPQIVQPPVADQNQNPAPPVTQDSQGGVVQPDVSGAPSSPDQAAGQAPATNTPVVVPPVKTPEQILQDKINYLLALPVLPTNPQQVRGVFPNSECLVTVQADANGMSKITLGKEDPGFDSWVGGIDPLTGESVRNIGGYGVIYHLQITAPEKTGVLLNPRGSIFKGAFQAPDGNVYKAPAAFIFAGLQQAAVLGVVQANQKADFLYTPPSGSDTPIIIGLIPAQFWAKPNPNQ